MARKKAPQERGFTIPVQLRIGKGAYKKGWAMSLTPDEKRQILVCYDSGKRSKWNVEKVKRVTTFKPLDYENRNA